MSVFIGCSFSQEREKGEKSHTWHPWGTVKFILFEITPRDRRDEWLKLGCRNLWILSVVRYSNTTLANGLICTRVTPRHQAHLLKLSTVRSVQAWGNEVQLVWEKNEPLKKSKRHFLSHYYTEQGCTHTVKRNWNSHLSPGFPPSKHLRKPGLNAYYHFTS